jgi:putative oxidoreductase
MTALFIIGRILLGGFFIYNAWNHFKHLAGLSAYAQSKGVPQPKAAVIATGVALAIGGLSILTGFFIILGMWLLVLFLFVTNFTMHKFWTETDPGARSAEIIQFTKNFAIAGGMLMLSAILALLG